MRIRIKKRAEVTGGLPANPKDVHIPGKMQDEGHSLPLDYWAEGELIGTISVGKPVNIARDIRNGIKCPGILTTSPVTEVTDTQFRTANSVYDYSYPEMN